jgi:SAM-dependent methyltransferase
MSTFDLYSEYYDLLYRDKDYAGEADYVISLLRKFAPGARTIMDLGCGTGKHAALFQKAGYDVAGVDLSETMLEQARTQYPAIAFQAGDARNVRLNRTFDAVTSLFHVASYQTSNHDLLNYLKTARTHLAAGGTFIFDFWYGPGVFNDPPTVRIKRLQNDRLQVTRIAEPTIDTDRDVVNVHYQVLVQHDGQVQTIVEDHPMRYFFLPELELALNMCGFAVTAFLEWRGDTRPSASSWSACIVATAQ